MAFSAAARQVLFQGTPVSSPPSSVNSFSHCNQAKINEI